MTTGTALGTVADVLLEEGQMSVVALLLSTSRIGNLLHGKPQLPLTHIQAIGADSVITPPGFDKHAASLHPPR